MEVNPLISNNVKRPRYTSTSHDLPPANPARCAGRLGSSVAAPVLSRDELNQDGDRFVSQYPKFVWSEPDEGASQVNPGDLLRVNNEESESVASVNPFAVPDLAPDPDKDEHVLDSFLEFLDDYPIDDYLIMEEWIEEGKPAERNVDSPIVKRNSAAAPYPTDTPFSVGLKHNSSSTGQQPKSHEQKSCERQAQNRGLFTPEGEPDVMTLRRLHHRHYKEKLMSEAKQIGMKEAVYQKFLKEELQKRNFPPRSQGLRLYVQHQLELAKKQGLPEGEETGRFVKAQLVNWKMEGATVAAASSSSSAAQPAVSFSGSLDDAYFNFDEHGESK